MTLQEAASSVARLARYEPGVVAELPDESALHVEINGILAGVIHCIPDAPSALAVGWAFMHGFFAPEDSIGSVTVHDDRVSLMVASGCDIDARRVEAVGWRESSGPADVSPEPGREPFIIHGEVLIEQVREALKVMARDRSRDGFVHAAIMSDSAIHCVARDLTTEAAVAKVLGWLIRDGQELDTPILFVRGMVDRKIVASAGSLGMSLIATSGVPTADAFREATGREISLLGMATNQRPGLLVDAGHVVEDDDKDFARGSPLE
jgi:formate dehydrogenase accessory protein FdhD